MLRLPSSPESVEWPEKEKDNAETETPQRSRRKEGEAGRGRRLMFTVNFSATLDYLSKSFLSGND